jgi:F0F1-type ATP synthase assembly protein I
MIKAIFYILSHVAAFVIGLYVATDQYVVGYRWFMTSTLLVGFIVVYHVLLEEERHKKG